MVRVGGGTELGTGHFSGISAGHPGLRRRLCGALGGSFQLHIRKNFARQSCSEKEQGGHRVSEVLSQEVDEQGPTPIRVCSQGDAQPQTPLQSQEA